MGLRERISSLRRGRPDRLPSAERAPAAGRPRRAGAEPRGPAARAGIELLMLGREMLAIPAQLWLAAAEVAGAFVLAAWLRVLLPAIRVVLALVAAAYRLALRHLTPARAVAAVALVALAALAASQWLDLRGVSVGTESYAGGFEAVAPAPEVDRARTGEAHAWVMVPLAAVGVAILGLAIFRRPSLARGLIAVGAAAIAVALAIDLSKGLDEGTAAIAYEGAEAHLLEGFWLQIAAGAVLIVTGLLLPRYLRPAGAGAAAPGRTGAGRRALGGARTRLAGAGGGAGSEPTPGGRITEART